MRNCMPAPRQSPRGYKRVVSSPPVATFSQAFMAFCWLGEFLCHSIHRPACHSLRSTCTVRGAFSVMLQL
jgi:hypothetical protein